MITYDEALSKILSELRELPAVELPLGQLLGHVLAQPVIAGIDSPPFDNSAVDGFGVRLTDVATATEQSPVRLKLSGEVRAGDPGNLKLQPGSAIKILTGGCVPATVDAVVMKEFCSENNGHVAVGQTAKPGENIRRRGGEFLRGAEVLPAGRVVTPPVVGLIANLGYRTFKVRRMPKAVVVTTGNELTKPGRDLLPGRIYDSNSYAMESALVTAGIQDVLRLHASEDEKGTKQAFKRALSFGDIVISTGGVSVGDYDYVKAALESLNVRTHIWKIAIKPGKPVYFGIFEDGIQRRRKYVFGLPGNPVSALVTFNLFVLPAIAVMNGMDPHANALRFQAVLTRGLKKKAGRAEFIRGRLKSQDGRLVVEPTTGQDSHMLGGLAQADALITFPLEAEHLEAGTTVEVRLLKWNL